MYTNLSKSQENYKERLSHHNNTAEIAAKTIGNIEGVINNFINDINQDIAGYKISNLSSVQLQAQLHPQYADMVSTLSRVSGRLDQLLPETFYEQIANFQKDFFISNAGKVDIAKIIEKINYTFLRNNTNENTPQSNGTNCMVNASLLALLFKKMIPEDLRLNMPVVFDEVGSLDEKNLQQILKVMREHGLFLFAANPAQNGVIASVLEVYHNLSVFKTTDVQVQGKAEAIYFPGMEERLEEIELAEQVAA